MGVRETLRESAVMAELLAENSERRPIIFYAEDSFTYAQLEGYVESLLAEGTYPVTYVTSDLADPLLTISREGLVVRHIDRQLGRFMGKLRGSVVVMTMPDLGQFHIPKPSGSLVLYLFHSLNSTHTSYRTGAFDHYDVFACTGPHHVTELAATREIRGLHPADLRQVGYYKLDRISRDHQEWPARENDPPEVLLAPSWGRENILEAHGEEIISALLTDGLKVIVRPHPQFFHSLYPQGRVVVERLRSRFEAESSVRFELSIDTENSFHDSDLMISDWSGAAFEYSLGTLRPVLFVDTPPKIFNPEWEKLGLPAFEAHMRSEVGAVIPTGEVSTIGRAVVNQLGERDSHRDRLAELRSRTVFNPGQSAEAGAALIGELVGRL